MLNMEKKRKTFLQKTVVSDTMICFTLHYGMRKTIKEEKADLSWFHMITWIQIDDERSFWHLHNVSTYIFKRLISMELWEWIFTLKEINDYMLNVLKVNEDTRINIIDYHWVSKKLCLRASNDFITEIPLEKICFFIDWKMK